MAACAALSDSAPPGMGIVTASPKAGLEIPFASLPMISAELSSLNALSNMLIPIAGIVHHIFSTPKSCAAWTASSNVSYSWSFNENCAPMPERMDLGENGSAPPLTSQHPVKPTAHAVRSIVPMFPGSATLSNISVNGVSACVAGVSSWA